MAEYKQQTDMNITPLQMMQINIVRTFFRAIDDHTSEANKELKSARTGYHRRVRHLVSILYKYFGDKIKVEIEKMYKDLELKCKEYDTDSTMDEKTTMINKRKSEEETTNKVFDFCAKTLMNCPIIESTVEIDVATMTIDREELKKEISKESFNSVVG